MLTRDMRQRCVPKYPRKAWRRESLFEVHLTIVL